MTIDGERYLVRGVRKEIPIWRAVLDCLCMAPSVKWQMANVHYNNVAKDAAIETIAPERHRSKELAEYSKKPDKKKKVTMLADDLKDDLSDIEHESSDEEMTTRDVAAPTAKELKQLFSDANAPHHREFVERRFGVAQRTTTSHKKKMNMVFRHIQKLCSKLERKGKSPRGVDFWTAAEYVDEVCGNTNGFAELAARKGQIDYSIATCRITGVKASAKITDKVEDDEKEMYDRLVDMYVKNN